MSNFSLFQLGSSRDQRCFHVSNFSLLQLGSSRDQRLIHQMEFADNQVLIVRAFTSGIGSGSPETQTKEVRST